eukprot:Nk52_evm11s2241 gene=Nk52_evmTU11s2241
MEFRGKTEKKEVNGFDCYSDSQLNTDKSLFLQKVHNQVFRYLFLLNEDRQQQRLAHSGPSWSLIFLGIVVRWLQVSSAALAKGFNWAETYMGWLRAFSGIFSASEWYFGIGGMYVAINALVIIFLIFQIAIITYTLKMVEPKTMSVKSPWTVTCIRVMNSMTQTFLFFPFMLILLTTVQCDRLDIDNCWSGMHIIFGSLSIIFAIWLFVLTLISAMTVFPASKSSANGLSRVHPYFEVSFIIFSFLLLVLWVAIDEEDMPWALTFYLLFATSLLILLIFTFLPYQNLQANKMVACMVTLWCWLSLCLLITNLEDDDSLASGALVFYLASPFLVLVTVQGVHLRRSRIQSIPINKLSNAFQVELKLRFSQLAERYEELTEVKGITITQSDSTGSETDEVEKFSKKELYCEIENFFSEAKKKIPQSSYLHLTWGLFYLRPYKYNIHKALKQFELAEKCFPKFQERFRIFKAQERIRLEYLNLASNKEVIKYLDFERLSRKAVQQEIALARSTAEFWTEMMKAKPDQKGLLQTVDAIRESMVTSQNHYIEALKYRSHSVYVLGKYGHFLEDYVGDKTESNKLLQKMHSITNARRKENELAGAVTMDHSQFKKTLFEEENAVVALSTEENHIGEIIDSNTACQDLFGYGRTELIGKNVSSLMPYPFSDMHDMFLMDFLESGNGTLLNTRRTVLGVDKSGFIIPIDLQIEEIISLNMRPVFVGALKSLGISNVEYALINNLGFVTYTSKGMGELFKTGSGGDKASAHVPITDWFPLWESQSEEFNVGKPIESFVDLNGEKLNLLAKVIKIKVREHILSVLTIHKDRVTSFMHDLNKELELPTSENETTYDIPAQTQVKKSVLFSDPSRTVKASLEDLSMMVPELEEDLLTSTREQMNTGGGIDRLSASSGGKSRTFTNLREKIFSSKKKESRMVRDFKVVLVLTVILMVALAIASTVVLNQSLVDYEHDIENQESLVLTEFFTVSLTYIVNYLRMIDAGSPVETNLGVTRANYKTDMTAIANQMEDLVNSMREYGGKLGSESPSPLAREYVDITEYSNNTLRMNLEDAILILIANARVVGDSPSSTLIDDSNVNAKYIEVNGHTTLYNGIVAAKQSYRSTIEDDYDSIKFTALVFLLSSLGCILGVLFSLIIPVIIKAENNKGRVFMLFSFIPKRIRNELLRQSEFKLAEDEGYDTANMNDVDEFAFDDRTGDSGNFQLTDKTKQKMKDQHLNLKSKFPFLTLLKVSSIFLFTVVFFVAQYTYLFVTDSETKENSHIVIALSVERRSAMRSAIYFANQYAYSLDASLTNYQNSVQSMVDAENSILQGNSTIGVPGSLLIDNFQKNLLFDNACAAKDTIPPAVTVPWPLSVYTVAACETYRNNIFSNGLHASILDMSSKVFDSLSTVMTAATGSGKTKFDQVLVSSAYNEAVISEDIYLQQSLTSSGNAYYQQTLDTLKEEENFLVIVLICFLVITLFVFIFVYIPLLKTVSSEISRSQEMAFLIPEELIADLMVNTQFKALFQKIFESELKD